MRWISLDLSDAVIEAVGVTTWIPDTPERRALTVSTKPSPMSRPPGVALRSLKGRTARYFRPGTGPAGRGRRVNHVPTAASTRSRIPAATARRDPALDPEGSIEGSAGREGTAPGPLRAR